MAFNAASLNTSVNVGCAWLTYTDLDAIVNGISLRRLKDEKQNISLCLVNLAKAYEHKFATKSDDFMLQCANLALVHDSLNLNAMLLKAQVLEEKVMQYAAIKHITAVAALKADKAINKTLTALEKQLVQLNRLSYRQMPVYMQQIILAGMQHKPGDANIIVQDRSHNPFPSLTNVAPEDKRYSTLSRGLFEEVFEKKKYEQYGRCMIDTEKKRIIKLMDTTNFQQLIDPVVFAWSVDPLAAKYPQWSPYATFANNPIMFIDQDGKEPIKPQAGTAEGFIKVINETGTRLGTKVGQEAHNALLALGKTEWSLKNPRPMPVNTGRINTFDDKYIYTEKGGWLDMSHFMFYAGRAYQNKQDGSKNPIGEAVQEGFKQEYTDKFVAPGSAYSYEDLPSDKFGAELGAKYFDPNSKQSFGEQLGNYLSNVLRATDPKNAPNYENLPKEEPTERPSRTNHGTIPVFTKDKP